MNNNAKYSVLYASSRVNPEHIFSMLKSGLKVILFLNRQCMDTFTEDKRFSAFISAQFLCIYKNDNHQELKIIDGLFSSEKDKAVLEQLEHQDERFNLQQYLIEHESPDSSILVSAGAGSGKTHVMINRLMYLMHCCKEFSFSRIALLTFTNESTDDMRGKLIGKLKNYYFLTGNEKYLQKIEEFSEISLSTLDSYFHQLLSEIGCERGFGKDISVKSYIYEKKELIRDEINSQYSSSTEISDTSRKVEETLGLTPYYLTELIKEYWDRLDNYGVSDYDLENLNWGEDYDETTGNQNNMDTARRINALQNSMRTVFNNIGRKYSDLKTKNNAISIKDALNELIMILHGTETDADLSSKMRNLFSCSYDYIFCDEFQDCDNMQILIMNILCMLFSSKLFIVGDTKQSIYRFRGATDAAFEILKGKFKERNADIKEFALNKNYRTCAPVMHQINRIFERVSGRLSENSVELFSYSGSDVLVPQNQYNGVFSVVNVKRSSSDYDRELKFVNTVREIMRNPACGRVVCLTRTNYELGKIKKWCETNHILCMISEEGSFYSSPAVKDLCALTEAFMYSGEPMYLWNYINSSYCMHYCDLNVFSPDSSEKEKVLGHLKNIIGTEFFDRYRTSFKNDPVMSVIRRIISEINPVNMYKVKRKNELLRKNCSEEEAEKQSMIDVKQYEADITKLLNILIDTFSGQFASLCDICEFLRLKITTDKTEELPKVKSEITDTFVEGMTVHSSKGLQFDNVILPFMDNPFEKKNRNEIIISRTDGEINVGWKYCENKNPINNKNYDRMTGVDHDETAAEEIRLLYVATTRAVNSLYCFKSNRKSSSKIECWQDLLQEVN